MPASPPRRGAGRAGAVAALGLVGVAVLAGCSASVQVGGPSGSTSGSPSGGPASDSSTASPSDSGSGDGGSVAGSPLDTAKAAAVITETIQKTVGTGTQVDISCPDGQVISKGATFECTGTVAGQDITLTVVQKDDQGNVSYESKQSLIEVRAAQDGIAADATKRLGATTTATCPAPGGAAWIVALPGATFDCTYRSSKGSGSATVTVKDNNGNITWKYTPA